MSRLEVDFWNVGQGDASSFFIDDNTIIIIDLGPRDNSLVKWLNDTANIKIHTLIFTHNDADHIAAYENLLNGKIRIDNFYFLHDSHNMRKVIKALGPFCNNIYRLERQVGKPHVIWENDFYKLELRFPTVIENELHDNEPNKTSAILCLSLCDDSNDIIIWGADNTIDNISNNVKYCNSFLFGPHHGAPIDFSSNNTTTNLKKISPIFSFISVGTNNRHKHPNHQYIKELSKIKCATFCSQLGHKCMDSIPQEDVIDSAAFYALPKSENKMSFQCRGHVRFSIDNGVILFDALKDKHMQKLLGYKKSFPCLPNIE